MIQTKEILGLIFNSIQDYAMYLLDPEGNVLTWNEGAKKLKGYDYDEIIGQNFSTFYIEEDQKLKKPANALAQAIYRGNYKETGFRQRKDGSRFWAHVLLTAIKDDNGDLKGFIKITEDVTQQVLQQEALRISEENFRSAMENAPIGMALVSTTGQWLRVNKAICSILGYKQEELLKFDFQALTSKEDLQKELSFNNKMLNKEISSYQLDKRFIHKNGVIVWAQLNVSLIWNSDGSPRYFIFQIQDITQRKKNEEDLSRLISDLELQRMVVDQFTIVAITDVTGKITYANELFSKISKYSKEELIGQDHRILNSGHHPKEYMRQMWRTIACGQDWHGELKNKAKDGSYYWVDTTIHPVLNKEGKPVQYISLRKDITSLKNLQEELKRSNKELEDFAFVASHDLQEPLRKVTAFGDLLNKECSDKLNETCKDYLRRMQSAAVRMSQFIQGILEYSRITTSSKPFENVDLNDVLKDVLTDLDVKINQLKVVIKSSTLPTIKADKLQMYQLFLNLLSNAIKFHQQGIAPQIQIDFNKVSKNQLEISFKDNGIGFEEKYIEKIFAPFQRLHSRQEYEGTGIGLTACDRIVRRHRGEIRVQSKLGEGSCFIVCLPTSS